MKSNLAQIFPEIDPSTKDGDDDGEETTLSQILIEVAVDGYMVTLSYDDGDEVKNVFTNFDDALKHIRGSH